MGGRPWYGNVGRAKDTTKPANEGNIDKTNKNEDGKREEWKGKEG